MTSSLATDLYALNVPRDLRPWGVVALEVLADTIAAIRAYRYTRRQVVILGVVCAAGLLAWAGFAIFVGIVVSIVTGA